MGKVRKINQLGQTLNRKEKQLQDLVSQKIDISEERQKIKSKNDKQIEKLLKAAAEITTELIKHKDCTIKRELAKKKLKVFDDNTGNVDQKIEEIKRSIRDVEYTLNNAKVSYSAHENRMNNKRHEALNMTDNIHQNSANFPYKKKFEKLPNTVEALQEKIEEMQGRIECIRGVDPKIIQEYEERKITIDELRDNLNREQERALALEDELKHLHEIWHPEIVKIVNSINENFSNFFAKMGFVGKFRD